MPRAWGPRGRATEFELSYIRYVLEALYGTLQMSCLGNNVDNCGPGRIFVTSQMATNWQQNWLAPANATLQHLHGCQQKRRGSKQKLRSLSAIARKPHEISVTSSSAVGTTDHGSSHSVAALRGGCSDPDG